METCKDDSGQDVQKVQKGPMGRLNALSVILTGEFDVFRLDTVPTKKKKTNKS